MSSYNLIPFTDLTATGFTNAVVTTSFTVNSFTVADSTGADAQRFIAVNPGSPAAPPFTFDADQRAGMWLSSVPTVELSFSVQGNSVGTFRRFGAFQGVLTFGGATTVGLVNNGVNAIVVNITNGFTTAKLVARSIVLSPFGVGNQGMTNGAVNVGFVFQQTAAAFIVTGLNSVGVPTAVGSYWPADQSLQSLFKPGVLGQATTTVTPSTARSLAHVHNFIAGATTVFVTLPTSVAGLQYTISNAQATTQTVVVNPVAADTLNVFGLTKAAGASVAANAPFSSITFHCLTSTMWLATKTTGTWT